MIMFANFILLSNEYFIRGHISLSYDVNITVRSCKRSNHFAQLPNLFFHNQSPFFTACKNLQERFWYRASTMTRWWQLVVAVGGGIQGWFPGKPYKFVLLRIGSPENVSIERIHIVYPLYNSTFQVGGRLVFIMTG